jgi:hypothetical protein
LSLSWVRPIQSTPPHFISPRYILILSSQIRLCLFPSGFPQISYIRSPPPPFVLHSLHYFIQRLCFSTQHTAPLQYQCEISFPFCLWNVDSCQANYWVQVLINRCLERAINTMSIHNFGTVCVCIYIYMYICSVWEQGAEENIWT